ncbi:MAG: hypothetical protein IT306_07940, partial [Chloroflexi bacterium]|nr:hypothetical protein [Chloroflexota bacterium]
TVYAHLNTPKNGFDFALRDVQPLFADAWPTLLLSLFAIPLLRTDRRALLPLLYLLVSTGLTLFSLRNTGGDVNYLIEPAAAACVPAALALGWLWAAGGNVRLELARVAISVVLAGALVVWGMDIAAFWRADGGVNVARLPLDEMAAADAILSEEPLAVLLAGKPLLVSDTFHLSMLATSGFFDPLELERRIKRSEFDLIVTRSDIRAARLWKRQPLLPEGVRLAIKDTYVQVGRVGIYWLYRPEGRRGR